MLNNCFSICSIIVKVNKNNVLERHFNQFIKDNVYYWFAYVQLYDNNKCFSSNTSKLNFTIQVHKTPIPTASSSGNLPKTTDSNTDITGSSRRPHTLSSTSHVMSTLSTVKSVQTIGTMTQSTSRETIKTSSTSQTVPLTPSLSNTTPNTGVKIKKFHSDISHTNNCTYFNRK